MKKCFRSVFALFLSVFVGLFFVFLKILDNSSSFSNNSTPSVSAHEIPRMKAVWVSFMDLNMRGTDYSETSFRLKYDRIVDDCKRLNINALVVHVRPFSDALYPSKYFPWSHYVSRTQGEDPGYDPLSYMVKKTHEAGMEFHAWVNPYRVQYNNVPNDFSRDNPFCTFEVGSTRYLNEDVVDFGRAKYYNPASQKVRDLIVDGVKEIVEQYDVDGIHFDDYFYPDSVEYKGATDFDKESYDGYLRSLGRGQCPLSLTGWRMENVNQLIRRVYSEVKRLNSKVVFGISPSCNNELNGRLAADVFTWCKNEGYVDYICPQVYVSLDHPFLPFKKAVDIWQKVERHPSVKLYYGLAVYKAGSDYDKGTWCNQDDILKRQVEYTRDLGCDGYMLFDYKSLVSEKCKREVSNLIKVL